MNIKRVFTGLVWGLIVVTPPVIQAQTPLIDSLVQGLESMPADTNKARQLFSIAYQYLYQDRDQAQVYADQLESFSNRIQYQRGVALSMYLDAVIQHFGGNSEVALTTAQEAYEFAKANGDKSTQAMTLNTMSQACQTLNRMGDALDYILECIEICEAIGEPRRLGIAYATTASLYEYQNELTTAKSYLLKALPLFESINFQYGIATIYQSLGVVSYGKEAIDYSQKGLDLMKQVGDPQGVGMCYWNMGTGYMQLNQNEKGLEQLQAALENFEAVDYLEGIGNINALIGTCLTKLNRFDEALPYLQLAQEQARQVKADDILLQAYRGLANYYAGKGNPSLVSDYIDSTLAIKDTLYSTEKANLLIESQIRLETQEKEAQIAQQNLQLERQSRFTTAVLLGSLLAITALIILFQFVRNRQKLRRQKAELNLQKQKAEAEKLRELDQLKSAFFANVSHEFRTPLSLILTPLQQMREIVPASDALKPEDEIPVPVRHLDRMNRNALRLQQLIDQLLDLSKLESGNMRLQVAPGKVIAYLRALVFSFESLAERRQIHFQTQFPEEPKEAYFDRDKLEKIVTNLLSNAFKFTPEKGLISVICTTPDRFIEIIITDTGSGIPAEELEKIFDRFYQVEGSKDQGTGIGLSLVKELMDLHKGQIAVESRPGEGTTFKLTIPISRNAFSREAIQSLPPEETVVLHSAGLPGLDHAPEMENRGVTDGNLPIALVVEDNPDLRQYIGEILVKEYQIQFAEDGRKGLEKAIKDLPDIIISDVMMPNMDGFELAEQIKTNSKTSHIPIILLTAKAGRQHKLAGLQTGADDYLTKPFDGKELRIRIKNLIDQRRRLRDKFKGELHIRPTEVQLSSMDERFLQQVMQEIENNLSNEYYTVEDLAKAVNFSRSQLHRKLRALVDQSPNQLIRDFRLTRAKEMLEQRAASVSEVAYQVGYSNLSYFSKSFKQVFGKTPSEI